MLKKISLSLFFIYLLYALVSFFILPPILKSQLKNIIEIETNSKLSIDTVFFNPFSFRAKINGVLLKTLDEKKIASFEVLEINLEPHSLLFLALHVKSITLEKPELFIIYNQDQTFNFSKIVKDELKSDAGKKEAFSLPRVIIDSFRISGGTLYYEDFTSKSKFELSAKEVDFKLENVDTADIDLSNASFRFNTFLSDGAEIDLRGKIATLKPLKLDGTLNLDEIKLYTLWRYIQEKTPLEIADGVLFFGTHYSINFDDLNATSMDETHLNLENLRVKPKDKNSDILTLKQFYAENAIIKPVLQDLHVQNVVLDMLKANIKRDAKGDIDWLRYLKKQDSLSKEKNVKNDERPWSVSLEEISLKKMGAMLDDESVKVKTEISKLNLDIKNFTLLGERGFSYKMDFILNNKGTCSSNGNAKHKEFELQTHLACKDIDIIRYRPYIEQIASEKLKTYNVLLKSVTTNFDANIALKDENSKIATVINNANISLNNFSCTAKNSNEKLVDFKNLHLKDIRLNTKTEDFSADMLSIDGLEANIKKSQSGAFNFNALIETKPRASKSAKTVELQDKKGYRVKLKSFDINGAKIDFNDESIEKRAKIVFDKIDLKAKDLDSKENSRFGYNLALRVNKRGFLKSSGEIMHTPLEQKGTLDLRKIPLKELTPYIEESTFLKVSDGYLNLKSKTDYKQKDKKADLNIDGELSVEEFFLHDSRDNSTIASFSNADFKSFSFKTLPATLYIEEVLLDSFYLDALIDENKNMNLSKLLKQKEQKISQKTDVAEGVNDEKFAFKLLKLQVSKGSANFADYSLPIDFKTSIHDLNGNIYAISNHKGEVAYVDIKGEVDEYGATNLQGSFDVSNIKSYMDIDFNFRNLNLNSLSGYSAQFAGYKIDKGKLFLDLKYEIKESRLTSKNSITIKNIKLGDEVEDENITKLPLGFAIALLENSDGVIDIDMPVEGNVDKPDFKYGTMVFKAFSKLIIKAVASPFTFLGKIFGIDGEKLKGIDFEAGDSTILPPEREKLDNLANILRKKPKLSLAISGSFDKERDLVALKSKKLKQTVIEMSKQEHPTIEILEQIYTQMGGNTESLKDELKAKTDKDLSNGEYQKELYTRCVDMQSILGDELRELAEKRATTIKNYLLKSNKIDAKKIILQEIKILNDSQGNHVVTELKIEVK